MRFHLFGLAHIPVAWERCGGRIAALVWNMAKMLKRHGDFGGHNTDFILTGRRRAVEATVAPSRAAPRRPTKERAMTLSPPNSCVLRIPAGV